MREGWFPIFYEVEINRLVKISTLVKKTPNRMIVTLQSLYHDSIGYQHVRTRVDFTKKAYPYKCNQEHKQEHERMQLNLQMNILAHKCGAL
jgi:uncharacterized protein YqiB (DUF1249 family)